MQRVEEETTQTGVSQEQQLTGLSRIRRVHSQPADPYDLIFLDQQDRIIVPLTEWYRLRKEQGPVIREVPISMLRGMQLINKD